MKDKESVPASYTYQKNWNWLNYDWSNKESDKVKKEPSDPSSYAYQKNWDWLTFDLGSEDKRLKKESDSSSYAYQKNWNWFTLNLDGEDKPAAKKPDADPHEAIELQENPFGIGSSRAIATPPPASLQTESVLPLYHARTRPLSLCSLDVDDRAQEREFM